MDRKQEQYSCDIAVIGSGVAGLCAAVQGALLGKRVILLETLSRFGGNWNGTYGVMGVQSPISKAQGIEVDAQALVNQEVRLFNYQVDSKMWMDLSHASGDNIAWLMQQGVEFEETLEPYTAGEINAPVFHRWAKGSNPPKKMMATFLTAGGTAMANTRAVKLLMENGRVAGLIAEKNDEDDVTEIEIRCRAVISAGGGYAKNPEMVQRTIGRTDYACRASGMNDGSAIQLCLEAGAKSLCEIGNQITDLIPAGMKRVSHWLTYIHSRPGSYPFHVHINQDGERYVDESCTLKLFGFNTAAAYTQEKTFTIYDEEKLRELDRLNDGNGVFEIMKNAADTGTEGIFRADSLKELAGKLGLNAETFENTMRRYNAYCDAGADKEYEKDPRFLLPIRKGPFYGWENTYQIASTLGGVDYNRKMEVLDNRRRPIPGLYVAGTDGAKLWRDYYSLAIPGSCNANNVYSGRRAALSAAEAMG